MKVEFLIRKVFIRESNSIESRAYIRLYPPPPPNKEPQILERPVRESDKVKYARDWKRFMKQSKGEK